MIKKNYCLMLLLLMSLFPFNVYALENVSETNNNDMIVVGNEPDEVINNLVPGEESGKEEVNNNLKEQPVSGGLRYVPSSGVSITSIEINTATLELWDNALPIFTASVPEGSNYSILQEAWADNFNQYFATGIYTSDEAQNALLDEQGKLITTIVPEYCYYYWVTVSTSSENQFVLDEAGYMPFVLNGEANYGYPIEEYSNEDTIVNTYLVMYTYGKESAATYVDSIELEKVNLNATVGKEPLYGATSSTDHIVVDGEVWYYYPTNSEVRYCNYSNSDYQYEDDELFESFEEDNYYNYALFITPDSGYKLGIVVNSMGSFVTATINGGIPTSYSAYPFFDENKKFKAYVLYVGDSISPIEETYSVVEHADTTIDKSEGTGLALRTDGSHEKYIGVYVDGKLVEAETAIDANGNSIVRFTDEYLQTLDVGEHEIAVSYNDGKNAYTSLTITDVNAQEEQNNNNAVNTVENNVTSNYVATTLTTNVSNVLQEKVEEPKKEESTEGKKDDTKEESKAGLWIGLVILGLIAVVIPIAIYKQDE